MRRSLLAAISSTALILLALSGCGSSGSTTGSTAAATKALAIPLTSSAITSAEIPALYTCSGRNISPPLNWELVPPGTPELVLALISVTKNQKSLTSVDWVMAGIKPGLKGLRAGQIPPGAFLERASNGKRAYSLCPAKGKTGYYRFALYAVPPLVRVTSKITAAELFRNLTEGPAEFRATAFGGFGISYKRK